MMNAFDFWVIKAVCPRKGPMKKAGIEPAGIRSERVGWKVYGRNRYPVRRYEAYVGFVDAPEGREALNAAVEALRPRFEGSGVSLVVSYVCRD
jgi:hypothetical protein